MSTPNAPQAQTHDLSDELAAAYPAKGPSAGMTYVASLREAKRVVAASLRGLGVPVQACQPATHDLFRVIARERLERDDTIVVSAQTRAKVIREGVEATARLLHTPMLRSKLTDACRLASKGKLSPGARELVDAGAVVFE